MRIVVGGCLAQKDRDVVMSKAPWVDVVLGTHNVHRVIDLLDHAEEWGPITEIWDETTSVDDMPSALRQRIMGFYRSCIQRYLYAAGEGRTYLAKNAPNLRSRAANDPASLYSETAGSSVWYSL